MLEKQYKIRFKKVMTDNAPEFERGEDKKNKMTHGKRDGLTIYTVHTIPNGKIERFRQTIEEDVIEGTTFESLEEFENEIFEYMIY